MSLQNFIKEKESRENNKITTPTPTTAQTGSLQSFMQQKNSRKFEPTDISSGTEDFKQKKETTKAGDTFRWIGKQLMKGSGVAAKEQRAVGESIGNLLAIASPRVSASEGIKNAIKAFTEGQKGAYNVLMGREETSILKEMEDAGMEITKLDKVLGISNELMVDPLNFLKPLKLTKQALEVTKLSKPLQALTKGVSEMDGVKKLKGLFSNATNNKEFDAVVTKFRNLANYKEGELLNDAVKLQKDIRYLEKKGIKNAQEIITEGLENPTSLLGIENKKILEIVGNLKTTYKGLLDESTKVGLKVGEIMDYAPHIRTKKSFLNKVKAEFGMGAKEFGIGAVEKGRNIIKLIPEKGKEIIGDWRKIGLRKINKPVMIEKLEKATAQKTATMQKMLEALTKKDTNLFTGDLQEVITTLRKNISKEEVIGTTQDLIEPTVKELDDIVKSMVWTKRDELSLVIKDLEQLVKTSQGKEFFKPTLGFKNSKNSKIKFASDQIIKIQNDLADQIRKMEGFDFVGEGNKFYKAGKATIKELGAKGIDIFEKNPAIQLAKKGQTYAKAITSKEFAEAVKNFAVKDGGVDVTNTLLKGLKFSPEQAKVIDNFYSGIKPQELKVVLKGFDKVQNLWKAQALISPSYHTRNMIGNLWNNFLAGINPAFYGKAALIQKGVLKEPKTLELAKKLGVLDEGFYAKEISDEIVSKVEGIRNWKKGLNPLSQQNYLVKLNRAVGNVVENNARLAHFMSKLAEGVSPELAAQSVKKYLFDYGDLTNFEKTIMKRVMPFYTWTRKNLPVQLTGIVTQPGKYALPHKIIERLESGTEKPNEKYMSPYIQDNVPVRIGTNDDGNTEYFLLGSWLPYASAIEVLSSPLEEMIAMITPLVKTPYEYLSNESTFFKDTLDEPAEIERRFKQQGEFIGESLRKKNILLLRNIRMLNDINKWVDKQDPTAVKDSWAVKTLNTLFGKASTYDVGKSKYYYDMDTDDRIYELKQAIKDATKKGYNEKAEALREELINFQQRRQND